MESDLEMCRFADVTRTVGPAHAGSPQRERPLVCLPGSNGDPLHAGLGQWIWHFDGTPELPPAVRVEA